MGDLSCGPSNVYYTPAEPLSCEPEALVCHAPPEPPKAPTKAKSSPKATSDQLQVSSKGKSASGKSTAHVGFLDEANQICRLPGPRIREHNLNADDLNFKPLDATLFTANLDNSQVVAELDLEVQDKDGLQNRSRNDIQGVVHSGSIAINRDLFAPGIEALKGTVKNNGDTTTKVKNVYYDAAARSYTLDLEVTKKILKIPVWDNFKVQVKANDKGEMIVEINDNWFPDKKVLAQLEQTVRDTLRAKIPSQQQTLRLETEQQDNQLILRPQLKNLEVPLGAGAGITLNQLDSQQAKMRFDQDGHLHVDLKDVKVSGSSGIAEAGDTGATPDSARLHVKIGLGKDGSRQALTHGKVKVNLSETETPGIKMGHDRLADYMRTGTIEGNVSIYVNQAAGQTPTVQSQSQVKIKDADLGNGQKTDLETTLKLDFDKANGIRLDTLDPNYEPLKLRTSENGVEFFVDGKEYYPEMKRMIDSAKESIALETFMFTNDTTGKELAEKLARKAAGLDAKGHLPASTQNGVDVRFVFNSWKGNAHDGEASVSMLKAAKAKVSASIDSSALSATQKKQAKTNLERNLNWVFFSEGILRSDHRKILVIDGKQATVGGMNTGDHYLGDKGYHDVMVKVAGPEVRTIHREFLENWYEFRKEDPEQSIQDQLKTRHELQQSLEELQAQGKFKQTAGVQTLVTDDRQVDIERGLVDLIDKAQTEINIEQAFFSDETINRHLAEAIKRGVKINVIVARDPLAAGVFKPANLLSAYELARVQKSGEAGKTGQIQLHYYSHENGGEQNHIHTKAISVDGQRAIIGSANMIGRSLSSPFMRRDADGNLSQAMYNKEMSLLLEGPEFVEEVNQRLFQSDLQNSTRALDADAIIKAVQDAGGEAELRKKALAAPFT